MVFFDIPYLTFVPVEVSMPLFLQKLLSVEESPVFSGPIVTPDNIHINDEVILQMFLGFITAQEFIAVFLPFPLLLLLFPFPTFSFLPFLHSPSLPPVLSFLPRSASTLCNYQSSLLAV